MTDTVFTNSHSIKIFFKGEIRRFSFTGTSFQQLGAEVQALLSISAKNIAIRYEDDEGDWVTIGSDSELDYAIQLVGSRTLRLRIIDMEEKKLANPVGNASPVISEKPWKEIKREAKNAKIQFKQEVKAAKLESKVAKRELKYPKSLYVARFVKHVTVEDSFSFAPGTPFVKTWRFRNEGTVAWPQNSVLLCVGKKADQLGTASDVVVLSRCVLPGEEIDVSVSMIAPSASGSYSGYWKLADPSGRKFGPRVRVLIKVSDSSSSSSDEGTSSWGEMLTQLESMGFTNKGMNVKLLVKTHGNMDKVIRKLLKRQEKMSGAVAKKS